jgi:hypothetical protein
MTKGDGALDPVYRQGGIPGPLAVTLEGPGHHRGRDRRLPGLPSLGPQRELPSAWALVGDAQSVLRLLDRPRFIDTRLLLLGEGGGEGRDRLFGRVGLDETQLALPVTPPLADRDGESTHPSLGTRAP